MGYDEKKMGADATRVFLLPGRAARATDIGRSCLPLLDWTSQPQISLYLFIIAFCSSLILAFTHHLIPWRLVLGVLGEGVLLAGHPQISKQLAPLIQLTASANVPFIMSTSDFFRKDALADETAERGPEALLVSEVWEEETQGKDRVWGNHRLLPPLTAEDTSAGGERSPPARHCWASGSSWTVDHGLPGSDARTTFCAFELSTAEGAVQRDGTKRWTRTGKRREESDGFGYRSRRGNPPLKDDRVCH